MAYYRRRQFLKGAEMPQELSEKTQITELDKAQRKMLAHRNQFFTSMRLAFLHDKM